MLEPDKWKATQKELMKFALIMEILSKLDDGNAMQDVIHAFNAHAARKRTIDELREQTEKFCEHCASKTTQLAFNPVDRQFFHDFTPPLRCRAESLHLRIAEIEAEA